MPSEIQNEAFLYVNLPKWCIICYNRDCNSEKGIIILQTKCSCAMSQVNYGSKIFCTPHICAMCKIYVGRLGCYRAYNIYWELTVIGERSGQDKREKL